MAGGTPAAPVQTKEIRIIKLIPNGTTVEPRYNEGLKDKQNVLAFKRFRYFKVLCHKLYFTTNNQLCKSEVYMKHHPNSSLKNLLSALAT